MSREVSQFKPPMLVSQERRIRPALDTVMASGEEGMNPCTHHRPTKGWALQLQAVL